MCDCGDCRKCRQSLRELDKAMGSSRAYIQPSPRSREDNYKERTVMSHGLLNANRSKINRGEAPVTLDDWFDKPKPSKAERQKSLREARREDRILDDDGRLYSPDCPYHGTHNGYINWYCRCLECSAAYSKAKALRNLSP